MTNLLTSRRYEYSSLIPYKYYMKLRTYTFTTEDLTEHMNIWKDLLIWKLLKEKVLTKEQWEKINSFAFVVHEKWLFWKASDFLFWKDDKAIISIIKI